MRTLEGPGGRVDTGYVVWTFIATMLALMVYLAAGELGDVWLSRLAVFYLFMLCLGASWCLGAVLLRSWKAFEVVPLEEAWRGTLTALAGLLVITLVFTFLGRAFVPAMGTIVPMYAAWPAGSWLARQARALGVDPNLLFGTYVQLVVAPAEESFFRVVALNLLAPALDKEELRAGRLPWRSVGVAGFAFGLFHFWAYRGTWWMLAGAVASGLLLGYLYWRTGRESAVTGAHFCFNMLSMALTYLRA